MIARKLGVNNLTDDPLENRAILLLAIDHLSSAYEEANYWADEAYYRSEAANRRAQQAIEEERYQAEQERLALQYQLWDAEEKARKCERNRAYGWG